MEKMKESLTASTTVNASVETVWRLWTTATDIAQWNSPSNDWQTSLAETDLKEGGKFLFKMEKKDKSVGFDHAGTYDRVVPNELIEYTGTDGRKSQIRFFREGEGTKITEKFEPDAETPLDVQQEFCQGVLTNFKKYAENLRALA